MQGCKAVGFVVALVMALCITESSEANIITFSGLSHGEVVSNQFSGLTISADNFNPNHPDKAIIFDTNLTGTADPDLQFDGGWNGGNLQNTPLGNVLIIAENDVDLNNDGLIDSPDDEAGRPAGTIKFSFDDVLSAFSFSFVDVDNNPNGGEDPSTYMLSFYLNNQLKDTKTFADLSIPGIVHGNSFANQYPVITSTDVGSDFDEVVVLFGGSGAIDNIYYEKSVVPEPATMALFGAGLAGAYARRRKKA